LTQPLQPHEEQELQRLQTMIERLQLEANGIEPFSLEPIRDPARIREATRLYNETKARYDETRYKFEHLAQERYLAERQLEHNHAIEHRRLDIEEERVRIQQAEVIVRALEVAARHGVAPEQLLDAIQQLGHNLLSSSTTSVPQLTKKE
jgi:hypothetical protein